MHIATPLVDHARLLGVQLKLEALQPAGSFKIRGVGHLARHHVERGATRLVSSSGGNAGLATAFAGRALGVEVVVVTPSTTPEWVLQRIRDHGAEVVEAGGVWDEADAHARTLVGARAAYVHPFDDPLVWRGHATLVEELPEEPAAVVLSVGGGGLLCGVAEGLRRRGWRTPILAVETHGAASLRAAMEAGEPVDIGAITSVAKTLGARKVAAEALAWTRRHPVESVLVGDEEALEACRRFAWEHRLLVEPSCGASLAAMERLEAGVVVVCGGAGVRLADLAQDEEAGVE